MRSPAFEPTLQGAFRACRRHLYDTALFSAFLNLLYLAPTLYMLQVYDRVVPTRGEATLAILTGMFLLAAITLGALDLIRTRLLVRASVRLDRRLTAPILHRLMQRHPDDRRAGSTELRDFDSFRQTVTGAGIFALFDAPWCPIYIAVCFVIHPAIGSLALAGAATLLSLSWLNEKLNARAMERAGFAASRSYALVDEALAGAEVIRGLGMTDSMTARILRERQESGNLQVNASFRGGMLISMTKTVRFLFQSIGLGLGAWLAIRGAISAGAIFAGSLLISRALQPIELVNASWRNILLARTTFANLVALFTGTTAPRPATQLPDPVGRIEVSNLHVTAFQSDKLLLQDISFTIEPGEIVGIVGPSGAGKSTLVRSLIGALVPAAGAVRLDGAKLADWPARQVGKAIGYLPQSSTLFRGTIKENITRFETELESPAAVDAALIRAAQRAGAHDFILRLPQGYETQIGSGAMALSAGQMQRIALARALYGDPVLVVLDEPNASMDSEGEARLKQAVADLRDAAVTVVIVAHHGTILSLANRVLVLNEGRLDKIGRRSPERPNAIMREVVA